MTETPTPPKVRHVPFWLVISLMANMMLVGLFAGLFLRGGPKPHEKDQKRPPITWVARDGDKAEVAIVMRHAFEASEEERTERMRSRKALAKALSKEPYDADAVRAAFVGLREADAAVQAATHEELVERFANLPVEERLRMADILMNGPMMVMSHGDRKNRGELKRFIVRTDRIDDDGVSVVEEHEIIAPVEEEPGDD